MSLLCLKTDIATFFVWYRSAQKRSATDYNGQRFSVTLEDRPIVYRRHVVHLLSGPVSHPKQRKCSDLLTATSTRSR